MKVIPLHLRELIQYAELILVVQILVRSGDLAAIWIVSATQKQYAVIAMRKHAQR